MMWFLGVSHCFNRIILRGTQFVRTNPYLSLLVLYYLLAFITPEKKLFVAFSVLFVIVLWFLYRSWNTALVLGYFAVAPFSVGQVYKFQILTPAQLFFDPQYPEGRNLFFVLSPAFLVGIVVVIKAAQSVFSQGVRAVVNIETIILFGSVLIRFVSALQASHNQGLSILYGLHGFILAAWLILALKEYQKRPEIVRGLYLIAMCSAVLNSALILLQLVKGGPVGTILEQRGTAVPGEIGVSFFRPFGLESHPNFSANVLLFGIFTSFLFYLTSSIRHRKIAISACLASLAGLIVVQSRAGYLGAAGGAIPAAVVFIRQTKIKAISLLKLRLTPPAALVGLVFIVLFTLFVIGRFYNTMLFSASEGGGFSVRSQLAKEAIAIIQEKPFFGIGPGMFIAAAYERNVTGVMYWFPEAVHNGFLLVASESGVFALVLSIGFIFFVFRRILTSRTSAYARAVVGGYVLSQVIFMWFHPVDNAATLQMAFVVLLLRSL